MPRSTFLNEVLNGTTLFHIGYLTALAVVALDTAAVLTRPTKHSRTRLVLLGLRASAVALTLGVVVYGFFFAIMSGRLPA